ncbi:glutaredoxin 2 [[Leptolyngbya] sp. PCC 7376]|uniref:glutaredoxin family protein n=1 Tax=[Leptolyngbya] sp. PCC 7376 TaxID=111781 RepID=UPI00029F2446|nr:glutaredoxin family protein [[Leptolyngbya] sp. PCC 7376]AFY38697.1 glutaredoxin 2 [[Leptolyngbya] sp. PCC 7376]
MKNHIIFYSKKGCHLCEGLHDKLTSIQDFELQIEMRDIETNEDWFARYEYEIPVLTIIKNGSEVILPRFSPRLSIQKIAQKLATYF